jgi:hypothetical protein
MYHLPGSLSCLAQTPLEFICTVVTSWLDGKHVGLVSFPSAIVLTCWLQVVFGTVIDGMDVVRAIGAFLALRVPSPSHRSTEQVPKGSGDRPQEDVIIADSGEVFLVVHFGALSLTCVLPARTRGGDRL